MKSIIYEENKTVLCLYAWKNIAAQQIKELVEIQLLNTML